MRESASMEQNLDVVERISVLERTVERNQIKLTSLRNRAGALNAGDFNFLAQIDATRKHIQMQVLAGLIEMDAALVWIDQLSAVRAEMTLPVTIYIKCWTSEKNRSISTLEFGDDEIRPIFRAHRSELLQMFHSLGAPELLKIEKEKMGYCVTEFAFIAWLWHSAQDISYAALQSHFNMEWSRLSKCVSTFQAWFFSNHSFRVTNALHFWASNVARWFVVFWL
jgi:hypothetical protein